MRDRRIQRQLRKSGEKGLSPKDSAGIPDPTPFEAVKNIIRKEKERIAGEEARKDTENASDAPAALPEIRKDP